MSTPPVTAGPTRDQGLLRRGRALEVLTLSWNVVGIVVLAIAAIASQPLTRRRLGSTLLSSSAPSTVVLWELAGIHEERQHRALRLIGYAFIALAGYLLIQTVVAFAIDLRPHHSIIGLIWTAVTAVVMFALAYGKYRVGKALDNPVLLTEGKVTVVDGTLATAVLLGVLLDVAFDWWWADSAASLVIIYYAIRQARHALASR